MTLQRKVIKDVARCVGVASSPEGLSRIGHPSFAAVIWKRQPLVQFQTWIDGLKTGDLPRARIVLRSELVRSAMTDLVETSGLLGCDERDMLVGDIAALADIFARVMRARYLRLRLDVISTNACRQFHIDAVTARLICTYRGSGTQYGISPDGKEPRNVCSVPIGSPMILRGTLWPGSPQSGLLHRSPPIQGTGETRLVLVLDPIADLESETEENTLH